VKSLLHVRKESASLLVERDALQVLLCDVVVCCSVLQCIAVCCSVLQVQSLLHLRKESASLLVEQDALQAPHHIHPLSLAPTSILSLRNLAGVYCDVAVCCSVLQRAVLQCVERDALQVQRLKITIQNGKMCVAVCCSVLQYVATCCSVLQHVATCCSVSSAMFSGCSVWCCSVLQCVAACCFVSHFLL